MAVLFTIIANAKRHHLEPFAYVRDLLVQMSFLYAECDVDIIDFTEASKLSATAFPFPEHPSESGRNPVIPPDARLRPQQKGTPDPAHQFPMGSPDAYGSQRNIRNGSTEQ